MKDYTTVIIIEMLCVFVCLCMHARVCLCVCWGREWVGERIPIPTEPYHGKQKQENTNKTNNQNKQSPGSIHHMYSPHRAPDLVN